MAFEINYREYTQDIADDAIVFIPKLDLSSKYKQIEYTLIVPSYATKNFIHVYFFGGTFDTETIHKQIIEENVKLEYTKLRGGVGKISTINGVRISIQRGDQFVFLYKDAANKIVSEKT